MTGGAAPAPRKATVALAARAGDRDRLARELSLFPALQLVNDDEADLLVIAGGVIGAERLAADARGRGCDVILCAPGDLATLAGLTGDGNRLIAPGRLGHTEVGQHLLAELSGEGAGRIHSLYLAVRGPVGDGFQAMLWDAVSMIDDCLNEPLSCLHAVGGAMFGTGVDTTVAIARSTTGTVVTVEVSCCLPPGGSAEVELEIMGDNATLRAMPFSRCIAIRSGRDRADRFWGEDPLLSMIADWCDGAVPDAGRLRRRLGVALGILNEVDPGGAQPTEPEAEER